jgi:hypothetical protein
MALNPSGKLSIGGPTAGESINLELSLAQNANSSLNQANFRTLAQVPAGQISISNFYGKSNITARGMFQAGIGPGPAPVGTNTQYVTIETLGAFGTFASIASQINGSGGGASTTRAILAGGSPAPAVTTVTALMQYATFGTSGSWTTFGNLTLARRYVGSGGNATRAINFGGTAPAAPATGYNTIDYTTIATAGNALAFGTLLANKLTVAVTNSPTRSVQLGGPAVLNTSTYVTIATTGNATPFGTLVNSVSIMAGGVQSTTRGITAGGATGPAASTNVIQYITTATTGNSVTFGNLTQARNSMCATSSDTRGVFAGGRGGTAGAAAYYNTIDYVQIATTGNATTWGTWSSVLEGGRAANGCSNNSGAQL